MIFLSDFMIMLKCLEDGIGKEVNKISDETGITSSHIYTFKKIFENLEWIKIIKMEKKHLLEITDKGLDIVKSINELIIKIGFEGKTLQDMRRVIKTKKEITNKEIEQIDNTLEELKTLEELNEEVEQVDNTVEQVDNTLKELKEEGKKLFGLR